MNWDAKKAEDKAAIDLLGQAIAALSSYYTNHSIELGPIQGSIKGVALQQEEPIFEIANTTAPDATFSDHGSHKGESKDAISMLTMIKMDLENEIKYATQFEMEETAAYLKAKKEAEDLRSTLVAKKIQLEQMIADRQADKEAEIKLMKSNIA